MSVPEAKFYENGWIYNLTQYILVWFNISKQLEILNQTKHLEYNVYQTIGSRKCRCRTHMSTLKTLNIYLVHEAGSSDTAKLEITVLCPSVRSVQAKSRCADLC